VSQQAEALGGLAADAFVVFDELHHAGDERAWGDGVRLAFDDSAVRLALSGTPFRSDTNAIPFVGYDDFGVARPDYEYGYGEALRDGSVVRPVYFPRIDGHMEWVGPDGMQYSHTFDDALDTGSRPRWCSATTPRRRPVSSTSPKARSRGSWPCAWSPKASTSPACASGCSPQTRRPSCSSARPWGAWCAGLGACATRSRS